MSADLTADMNMNANGDVTGDGRWVSDTGGLSGRAGGRLMVHAFIGMFLGFIGGFVWLIQLAEGVLHILPLPSFEIDVPDETELLRNAHTGTIMNAVYVMVMLALSQRLRFSERQARWFFWGSVVMLWGNIIGYSAAVYAPERGLQPVGDWPNLLSYGTFYAAVVGASIATGICLSSAISVAKGRR
ncbi:MAG: hypothetical protein NTZ21_06115 [Actinobacteria bacterium]|nr:hypothetical protein [Actinomycetota bacterium]